MNKKLIVGLLFSIFASVSNAGVKSDVEGALQRNDYVSAGKMMDTYLSAENPDENKAVMHYYYSQMLFKQQKFDLAKDHINQAFTLDKDNVLKNNETFNSYKTSLNSMSEDKLVAYRKVEASSNGLKEAADKKKDEGSSFWSFLMWSSILGGGGFAGYYFFKKKSKVKDKKNEFRNDIVDNLSRFDIVVNDLKSILNDLRVYDLKIAENNLNNKDVYKDTDFDKIIMEETQVVNDLLKSVDTCRSKFQEGLKKLDNTDDIDSIIKELEEAVAPLNDLDFYTLIAQMFSNCNAIKESIDKEISLKIKG